MKTIEKLQARLGTLVRLLSGYEHKELAERVVCKDGTTISVQASAFHYSTPRSNSGPYTHVEVWCASVTPTEFDYNEDGPTAQVPIELVAQFIDNHGGLK